MYIKSILSLLIIALFTGEAARPVDAGDYREKGSLWQIDLDHSELANAVSLDRALTNLNIPEPKKTLSFPIRKWIVAAHPYFNMIDETGGRKGVSIIGFTGFAMMAPVPKGSVNIDEIDNAKAAVKVFKQALETWAYRAARELENKKSLLALLGRFDVLIPLGIFGKNKHHGVRFEWGPDGQPKPYGHALKLAPGKTLSVEIRFWPYRLSERGVAVLRDGKHVLTFSNFDGRVFIGDKVGQDPIFLQRTGEVHTHGDSKWTYKNNSKKARLFVFVGHYKTNNGVEDRQPPKSTLYLSPFYASEISPNRAVVYFDDPITDSTDNSPPFIQDAELKLSIK